MAEFVAKDYFLSVNGVDLSDHVQSFSIPYAADAVESTAMGDDDREYLPGLRNWSASLTMRNDFAASQVDATLFPLVGAAAFAVIFRPTSAAASATNPEYTGNAILTNYDPFNASVGDLATTAPTLQGTGALSRATS